MADTLNPYDFPDLWGKVIIGGIYIPGRIEDIDGVDKPERWLVQQGVTVSNAWTIWRGRKLAEDPTIITRLNGTEEFNKAIEARDILRPPNPKRPPVLAISNGFFNWSRIRYVSVKNIGTPKPVGFGMSWRWKIVLIEYNKPKPVPVGPPDSPKGETENDRLQKEFSGLFDKAVRMSR